jgi:hypothetical protein
LNRYYTILVTERDNGLRAYGNIKNNEIPPNEPWVNKGEFKGYLDALNIELVAPCEYMPYYGMDEHCKYIIIKLKLIFECFSSM